MQPIIMCRLCCRDLDENSIRGSIPLDWMQDGAMPDLEHLSLAYTLLDEIPILALTHASALPNIKFLGLAGCNLTGRLPELPLEPGGTEAAKIHYQLTDHFQLTEL